MAEIKACIFDLDGVVVDTARYHFQAWNMLAKELGIHFTEEDNEQLKGVSRMASLEVILKIGDQQYDDENKMEMAERKNRWYKELISQMQPGEILPGVVPFLDELREHGIRLAIGSASKNAPTILLRVGVIDYFDAVIDGNVTTYAKPHPETFLNAAHALGVDPVNCVVFEDAFSGIQAARSGDMRVIGVGSKDVLGEADYVIDSFAEMDLKKLLSIYAK
ncbi:MAG: beta-phosphoglucomutase [Pseudomonadota bacterium]